MQLMKQGASYIVVRRLIQEGMLHLLLYHLSGFPHISVVAIYFWKNFRLIASATITMIKIFESWCEGYYYMYVTVYFGDSVTPFMISQSVGLDV